MKNILSSYWFGSGLEPGDTILIHSSLRRNLRILNKKFKVTPDDIIDSFLNIVGPKGTLIFPTFNFGFGDGLPFDINETPSHMGILTEIARKRTDFTRTGHPIYSFAVTGFYKELFVNLDNYGGYDVDSPFGLIRKLNGKIGVIDLEEQLSMTFYHHIEEMNNVNYRYHKKFSGLYTNKNGLTETKEYGLFVRDLSRNIVTSINPAGELLWKNNLYSGYRPGISNGFRTINSNDLYDFISDNIIKKGKAEGLLYNILKED